MQELQPPLDQLLTLGKCDFGKNWYDYTNLGFRLEHAADLIRTMQDHTYYSLGFEDSRYWTAVHARRVLGALRSEAAVAPLIEMLPGEAALDDDLFCEDFDDLMGMIGPKAIAPLASALQNQMADPHDRGNFAGALQEIAQKHPDSRGECVQVLSQQLEHYDANGPETNAYLVASLLELAAIEAMPVIEAAYSHPHTVNESIVGSLQEVKYEFGVGPKPPPRRRPYWASFAPIPGSAGLFTGTAAGRAQVRAKDRRRAKQAKRKSRAKAHQRNRR